MRIPYLQASDTTDQQPGVTTPVQITMDTTDESKGITHSGGTVTVVEAGVYFIVAAVQSGETNTAAINHDVWMRKSDTDIPNSNTRYNIKSTTDSVVLVAQVAIRLAIGDTIKVYQSIDTTGKGAGAQATAPAGESKIPSIIFTMYKISD